MRQVRNQCYDTISRLQSSLDEKNHEIDQVEAGFRKLEKANKTNCERKLEY